MHQPHPARRERDLIAALALALAAAALLGGAAAEAKTPPLHTLGPHNGEPQAIAPQAPQWTLQVDPLTTALGFVHLQVERALSDNLSLYAGPSLRLFSGIITDPPEDFIGLGLEAGVRYFIFGGAPEGWWAQVRGVGAFLQTTDDRDPAVTAFGGYVSALGGYTWISDGGLVLAGGLGVQRLHYKVGGLGIDAILPAAHSTLGFAF